MTPNYLADLFRVGLVAGSDATPQDYQDALRAVVDHAGRAAQHGDDVGVALARLAMAVIITKRPTKLVPY